MKMFSAVFWHLFGQSRRRQRRIYVENIKSNWEFLLSHRQEAESGRHYSITKVPLLIPSALFFIFFRWCYQLCGGKPKETTVAFQDFTALQILQKSRGQMMSGRKTAEGRGNRNPCLSVSAQSLLAGQTPFFFLLYCQSCPWLAVQHSHSHGVRHSALVMLLN